MCAALCKPQNAAMLSKLVKPLLPGIGTRLASGQGSSKHYDKLMNDTKFYRNKVVNHPLFSQIHDLPQLRIFMQDHVFAVYDFMSLLKNLQGRFTNLNPLWTPPSNRIAARLINEIVLGEECDEINKEKFVSHYELYTQAMEQVNADIKPVLALSNSLEMHRNPTKALEAAKKAGATDQAIQFVKDTWEVSVNPNKSEVEVAAYFLFGREDPIPDMFRSIMKQVPELYLKDDFVTYLERHIHLDEEEHGPMARRLLESLCKHDEKAWQVCTDTAAAALESRAKLWDGTLKTIKS